MWIPLDPCAGKRWQSTLWSPEGLNLALNMQFPAFVRKRWAPQPVDMRETWKQVHSQCRHTKERLFYGRLKIIMLCCWNLPGSSWNPSVCRGPGRHFGFQGSRELTGCAVPCRSHAVFVLQDTFLCVCNVRKCSAGINSAESCLFRGECRKVIFFMKNVPF